MTANDPPVPTPNVLVAVVAGVPDRWAAEVDWPRRTRRRLLTNVAGHAKSIESVSAGLLWARPMTATGSLGGDEDQRHLGHLLEDSHDRRAFLGALPTAPRAWLDGGFDDLAAETDSVGAATKWIKNHGDDPWFCLVIAPDLNNSTRGLVGLVGAAAADSTIVVVVDATGLSADPARALVHFDLTTPEPLGDPVAQFHPVFNSIHGLLPAILVEMLIERPGPWRPGALPAAPHDYIAVSTAVGDGAPANDDEYASQLRRLAFGDRDGPDPEPMSLIVATNDRDELEANLLREPLDGKHQWLIVDNEGNRYESISALYEDAAREAEHDLVLFLHQDVLLPTGWDRRLTEAVQRLETEDPDWGVIGSAGVRPIVSSGPAAWAKRVFGHWTDPHGYKYAGPLPHEVESLDEMWLGVRRSSGVRFDPLLPGFHCYGIDLSLTARAMGRASYAVDAWMWHKAYDRTGRLLRGPDQSRKITDRETQVFASVFGRSYDYVAEKWARYQPFNSTTALWGVEPGAPHSAPWPSTPRPLEDPVS